MRNDTVVVAVNLRDCGNVGAIARSATAFGFSTLVTVGTTPDITRKEVQKVALGGGQILSTHYVTLQQALANYPNHYIIALETSGESLSQWNPPADQPLLILVGGERHGLSEADMQLVDSSIAIPHQTDMVKSLNVAAAFAIAAYTLNPLQNSRLTKTAGLLGENNSRSRRHIR